MTALLIARITVLDPEKMQAYAEKAGPTVATHGGEFVTKGKFAASFMGDPGAPDVAVLRFPSVDAAQAWHESPEYQALIGLRTAAAEMDITLYETA